MMTDTQVKIFDRATEVVRKLELSAAVFDEVMDIITTTIADAYDLGYETANEDREAGDWVRRIYQG